MIKQKKRSINCKDKDFNLTNYFLSVNHIKI